jgi:hypothetical protein
MSLPIDKSESKYCGRNFERSRIALRNCRDDLGGTLLDLIALQRDEINYIRPGYELCEWAKIHAP